LLKNSGSFAFLADGCPILARFFAQGWDSTVASAKVFAFALDFVFDFALVFAFVFAFVFVFAFAFDFVFGWRSAGVPITPGFGVMGRSGLPLR
jgi:hypothetical protein